MNEQTINYFKKLEQIDWFINCGKPFDYSSEIATINTWASAIEISNTLESENARLEARNELSIFLHTHNRAALREWNNKVDKIEPIVKELLETKLTALINNNVITKEIGTNIKPTMESDMSMMAIANEYKHLIRTRYYELLEDLYIKGHFPCGWIGDVPEDMEDAFQTGRLAVL